ncbi:MAG: hypothetical protein U0W24_03240 [Bacteroidales bacterium]
MKKLIRILLYIILVLAIGFIGLILTAVITDYSPAEVTDIEQTKDVLLLEDTLEFDILNWNIGYCGLDKSMDFFYDGGIHVRPSRENVVENLNGIQKFLKLNDSVEFILLQEVDLKSKRSYRINEFDSIQNDFNDYHAYLGKNYDVFFVPTPVTEPYGKVLSGLMSVSKFQPSEVKRYSFPGKYAFPKSLFMLDRCFLVKRFPLKNGKEFILINTHNEAYDDGSQRKQQMEYLNKFLVKEYDKGNYIVVGGDWNQCPPEIVPKIDGYIFDTLDYSVVNKKLYPSDWKWVYKNDIPTNRRVKIPYEQKNTPVTVIDFFLISPNVENLGINNINLGFENSDHQPVLAKFRLKK